MFVAVGIIVMMVTTAFGMSDRHILISGAAAAFASLLTG